ncbi:MAG: DUF192 domain-containing protein, partial [Actinomycetota bacterium]|nr:DUF192 domain-containing protein [Actinomycetota bacterium]
AETGSAPSASTEPAATAPASTERRPLEGFGETAFRVTPPGGPAAAWCALLADSDETRATGLMEQRDLRGYDGMVFRFSRASAGRFHMRGTLIPLSIAFFDADGAFVSSADMVPCPDRAATCPTYGADGAFLHALEVPGGGLDELGVGPGSRLSFPATACSS